MYKICLICQKEFIKNSNRQNCCSEICSYIANRIKDKIWRIQNKEKRNDYSKNYYKTHKKLKKLWDKRYRLKHKKELNNYSKNRRKNDINFKIRYYLRIRLRKAIKGLSKSIRTLDLLGCSIEQLREHLQKQFRPGMTWDNYGKWHIDHIKPCASFDLQDPIEQAKCFNYTNLQPLWAKENLRKGNKIL